MLETEAKTEATKQRSTVARKNFIMLRFQTMTDPVRWTLQSSYSFAQESHPYECRGETFNWR